MPNEVDVTSDITKVLAEAKASVRKIEKTSERIQSILHTHDIPTATVEKVDSHTFSIQFISYVLGALVVLFGLFGTLFFFVTRSLSEEINTVRLQCHRIELSQTVDEINRGEKTIHDSALPIPKPVTPPASHN